MDKKSKKILMRYMDDTKRKLLSFEEIAYAKEHGAILEELSISHEEAIRILTQSLKCISLSDAANSFLYSLSTRDMEYRYILASYIYVLHKVTSYFLKSQSTLTVSTLWTYHINKISPLQ